MTPRTLWTIVLKITGFFILLQFLNSLPYQITSLISATTSISGQRDPFQLLIAAGTLFSISIYLFMIIAFIFRTNWLIKALRLENAIIEEKLEPNIHRSIVLQIALIVSGILLLAESLPQFLKDLFTYFQQMNDYDGFKKYPAGTWIIFHLVNLLIGFFMVSSSRLIVNFIERKRKGRAKTEDAEA